LKKELNTEIEDTEIEDTEIEDTEIEDTEIEDTEIEATQQPSLRACLTLLMPLAAARARRCRRLTPLPQVRVKVKRIKAPMPTKTPPVKYA
jgi:hypothetical protein